MTELLVCPNCRESVMAANTTELADTASVVCKRCQAKTSLGELRLTANLAEPGGELIEANRLAPARRGVRRPAARRHSSAVSNGRNELGVAAFVTSIVGLVSMGCLSPIALVFSLIALQKQPRGMAAAGLVLSLVGVLPGAMVVMFFMGGIGAVITANHIDGTSKGSFSSDLTALQCSQVRQVGNKFALTVTNTSSKTIVGGTEANPVRVDVVVTEANGNVVARGRVNAHFDSFTPGEAKTFVLTPPSNSPLHTAWPKSASAEANILTR